MTLTPDDTHTYAHVTVTVVMDGETTNFDIPKAVNFEAAEHDDPVLNLTDDRLPRRQRQPALTFTMRPLTPDDGIAVTVTRTG